MSGWWRERLPVLAVFAAGVAFTLLLVAAIPDEVFYSGDAGVKALLTKQFSRGNLSIYLDLPALPRVQDAWNDGLYPFTPPFVYATPQGQAVAFPFLFQLACAPFYAALGFRGLYVVPLLSVWILWALFCRTLSRLAVPPWIAALALASLIFASHLTLYAATFWEHTLGALLAYLGVDYVVTRRDHAWKPLAAAFAGLACGLAFVVRSEGLIFAFFLGAFVLITPGLLRRHSELGFLGGVVASMFAILALNAIVYGQPLGLHGRQVVQDAPLSAHFVGALDRALRLFGNFALHVPLAAFGVAYVALLVFRQRPLDVRAPTSILFPCLAFLASLPIAVLNTGGRQIGPRYALFLCPVFALLVALGLLDLARRRLPLRAPLYALLGIGLCAGLVKNSVVNARALAADYSGRVAPALAFLRGQPARVVIVNDTVIAQELAALLETKAFLLALAPAEAARAAAVARELGESSVLMATFPSPSEPVVPGHAVTPREGQFGQFRIHDVTARASP